MIKTIKIQEETHAKLMALGVKGETFDDIINKVVDIAAKQLKKK